MIDKSVNPLSWVILVLPAHEAANGSKKNGEGCVRVKMIGTDECGLDIGGFVFVLHIIECCTYGFFQRLLIIANKNIVKT